MWKRIKEWFFGKEEEVKDEYHFREVDIGSTNSTEVHHKIPDKIICVKNDKQLKRLKKQLKRIKKASFVCKKCKKTVARLKNQHLGMFSEYKPLEDKHFQLVRNQYSNIYNKKFSLSDSGCHHCGHTKLDYKVRWGC